MDELNHDIADPGFGTAVLLIVFNRPNATMSLLKAIESVRPRHLMIVADGPRAARADDEEKCRRVRELCEQIDWPCVVQRNYSDINLGCRRRVSSGISWAIEQVDRAIILEDDCVPNPSFFRFCDELLERYAEDQRIMAISGNNFQPRQPSGEYSYYFSRYPHCWGWATWRRAWVKYDDEMSHWHDAQRDRSLDSILESNRSKGYWSRLFADTKAGKIDSWAYRWTLSCWFQNGLTVLPDRNLVTNIGFNAEATHTLKVDAKAIFPAYAMPFPLRHPPVVVRSAAADRYTENRMFSGNALKYARFRVGRAAADLKSLLWR